VALLFKKKQKVWIFIALDRHSKTVLDFQVGSRSNKTLKVLMNRLNKLNIVTIHTDNFKAYKTVIDNNYNLTTTKDQTTQIESLNSVVRSFLPRFKRKTKAYSKSIYALYISLVALFNLYNKKIKKYFENQNINYIFLT
jgi:IS1 family transposase